jgi:hypothetical protein
MERRHSREISLVAHCARRDPRRHADPSPPITGTRTPAPAVAPSAPASAAQLEKVAQAFADSLAEGDTKSLIAYWGTQRGVPPEFDKRLLAKSRDEIGRDLDMNEKRFARVTFTDAVRLKAGSP